jgi:hypothetical protein
MTPLKDSFVGLFKTLAKYKLAPVITNCSVLVSEYINSREYQPMSTAKFDITNLDVDPHSLSGVSSLSIEIGDYVANDTFKIKSKALPPSWIKLSATNLPEEFKKQDSYGTFLINGVPAHPEGYYHKFRLQALNASGSAAIFRRFDQSVKIKGSWDGYKFTADEDQGWIEDSLQGFTFHLEDKYGYRITSSPLIAITNLSAEVEFTSGNPLYNVEIPRGAEIYMRANDSTYYYVLGEDGYGIKFNGVDDLAEMIMVPEVSIEFLRNNWVTGVLPKPLRVNKNSVRIKFSNMFGHPGGTFKNGYGEDFTVTDKELLNIDKYIVYVKIGKEADDEITVEETFPDEEKDWYVKEEIIAPRLSRSKLPYITFTLNDLPRERYLSFAVGATGSFSKKVVQAPTVPPEDVVKFTLVDETDLPNISFSGEADTE